MNLILHLVKKDLRQFALYLILFGIFTAISVWVPTPKEISISNVLLILFMGISSFIITLSFITRLIQSDSAVNSQAHWLTRPISSLDLLTAKMILLIGFFSIVPAMFNLTYLNQVPFSDVCLTIAQDIMISMVVILPIAVAASLTQSFAAALFATGAISLLLSLPVAVQFMKSLYAGANVNMDMLGSSKNLTLESSRTIVIALLAIGVSITLLIYQYITRNTRRTVIGIFITFLFFLFLPSFWTWDFLISKPKSNSTTAFDSKPLELQFEGTSGGSGSSGSRHDFSKMLLIKNQQPQDLFFAKFIKRTFTLPDGTRLGEGFNDTQSDYKKVGGDLKSALKRLLPEVTVYDPVWVNFSINFLTFESKESEVPLRTPGTYQGTASIEVGNLIFRDEIPLEEGTRFLNDSTYYTIKKIQSASGGLTLTLDYETLQTRPLFDPIVQKRTGPYLLINRKRNEAYCSREKWKHSHEDFDLGKTFSISKLAPKKVKLDFGTANQFFDKKAPLITPEWLRDAKLIPLGFKKIATFEKELTVPNLVLSPVTPKSAPQPTKETSSTPPVRDLSRFDPKSLEFDFHFSTSGYGEDFRLNRTTLQTHLTIKNNHPQDIFFIKMIKGTFTLPDGTVLGRASVDSDDTDARYCPETALQSLLPKTTIYFPVFSFIQDQPSISLLSLNMKHSEIPSTRGTYQGTALVELQQLVLENEIPLKEGTPFLKDSQTKTITKIQSVSRGLTLTIEQKFKKDLFKSTARNKAHYLLINRKQNEAYCGREEFVRDNQKSDPSEEFITQKTKYVFGMDDSHIRKASEITPEWLRDAQLIPLGFKKITSFEKEITATNVVLRAPNDD